VSREVPIDAQHRSEAHFSRKLRDIPDEAKPIVFRYVCPLGSFIGSRNLLTTHRFVLLSVYFCSLFNESEGADRDTLESGRSENYSTERHYNTGNFNIDVTIRLPFRGKDRIPRRRSMNPMS